jgi:very-short-patch-repair endonuclease
MSRVARRLIVELAGSQHADNQSDRIRDAYLRKQGWHILRFWNNEVNESLEGVLMVILDWLQQAPTLTLPRKRERE